MTRASGSRILVAVAAAIVAAAVIAGMVVLGPPGAQRQKRLDVVRVRDLASLERLVSSFARLHGALPPDLASLARESGYAVPRTDPEGKPYEYESLRTDRYRLCATFKSRSSPDEPAYPYSEDRTWAHGIGRECFNRRVQLEPGTERQP